MKRRTSLKINTMDKFQKKLDFLIKSVTYRDPGEVRIQNLDKRIVLYFTYLLFEQSKLTRQEMYV